MASRLSAFISGYIHKDQVGFIPGRQGPNYICRAVNIISLLWANWLFTLSRLTKSIWNSRMGLPIWSSRQMRFGPHLIWVLQALYSNPSAQVKLQGHYSDNFSIYKETRQGCPSFPIIFAIAIETLALAIRNNSDICGVRCGQCSHKCALFADDLLLFLNSVLTLTPIVYSLLKSFRRILGLHVNMAISIALNINIPTSLVELLKMTLLPRLLYLFRSLPIPLQKPHLQIFLR